MVPGKTLSKLEAHLLKLVIPFIRIAQVPGYGEFKIKGPMITVEADVNKTLNEKILPRQQELIPVTLKRKFTYKENVMEEIVSKSKIRSYFNYFKSNNPLFKNQELNDQRIDEWIISMKGNIDNLKCQDCENEEVHICPLDEPLDELEDIKTINELNNERDDNEEYYDTVLDTFYEKTDNGNGVSDVIAEQIVTNCGNKKVIVAPTDAGNFMNYESDVHIEEKCFPHLFPKGVGGYMSTYFPQKVTFSN